MADIRELLDIMAALRDPEHGCPWDLKQDFSSIAPYTIEEAYEVADAIQRGHPGDLKDELGDLLFQVVFHAQMASEQQSFGFGEVVAAVCEKMVRRHPHVFDGAHVPDASAQAGAWEQAKEREREGRGADSLMDEVPRGMAELQRAVKLQKRAARAGFDWAEAGPVLAKVEEETEELREALLSGGADEVEDELGDLLFVVTNLARKLKVDPARALRRANAKFERRFRAMESAAGGPGALDSLTLDEMETLWQQVKREMGKDDE
jgi:MazG family protein